MGGQILSFNCDAMAQRVLRASPFVGELRFVSLGACSSGNILPENTLFLVHCPMAAPEDLEVAVCLKKQHPSIPVLVTAHRIDAALVLAALREHIWDFIVLPGEIERLTLQIAAWLQLRQLHSAQDRRLPWRGHPPAQELYSSIALARDEEKRTAPAVAIIHQRYGDKLPIHRLAAACHMSEDNFRRCFKAEHGCSIRDYLRDYRLARAVELLKRQELNVQEVAFLCGFHDVSLFNRLFKRAHGATPSQCRLSVAAEAGVVPA